MPDVTKLDARIAGIEEQLKQLRLRRQRVQARQSAIASRQQRREDTRRKILVGAVVLTKVERGEIDRAALHEWLLAELTRPGDRELFDLIGP